MNDAINALAPCPFCQGGMMFRKALWPSDGCVDAVIHEQPTECGLVEFSNSTTDGSIIELWNTRASTPKAMVEREAIARSAVEHCARIIEWRAGPNPCCAYKSNGIWIYDCTCQNDGDLGRVASWCADMATAQSLRSEPMETVMTTILHDSDCAKHNMPAYPNGPCDCGADAILARLDEAEREKCDHPIDSRFGSDSLNCDGSGSSEWRCMKCGHHEKVEWPASAIRGGKQP